jgi:hypothetical protein
MEFVPFQTKRGITSPKRFLKKASIFGYISEVDAKYLAESKQESDFDITSLIAILTDISGYLKKQYSLHITPKTPLSVVDFTTFIKNDVSIGTLIGADQFTILLSISSLFTTLLRSINTKKNISHGDLQSLLTTLHTLNQELPVQESKRYRILPPVYQTFTKRILLSINTRDNIAQVIESRSKAKKYLRILLKQYGIYPHKKPPLSKKPLQSQTS